MAISEIIRFTLSSTLVPEFTQLRNFVARNYNVKNQYFGYMIAPKNAALPIKKDEMCWVIQWPQEITVETKAGFYTNLRELTKRKDATSLQFNFDDSRNTELIKALESPVSEFAIINQLSTTPRTDPAFIHSMHKTYTDCYGMDGFTGGDWTYARNTNDTSGVTIDDIALAPSPREEERRLACYYLGWESVEKHEAASKTELFFEEMSKLMPWFGPGSGAWYVVFEKHIEEAEI